MLRTMPASSLLARAKTLLSSRAGVVGALVLTPAAAVQAQAVFTPISSAFYTTTSGQPDYAGSYGDLIGASAMAGGVKAWGDSGVRARDTFSYLADGWDGPELRYRDGLTLAWRGGFTGSVTGGRTEGETWVEGDTIAVAYDFTIERTHVESTIDWEILFSFDGYRQSLASGSVSGEEVSFNVSGSARGGNPLTWSDTPVSHTDTPWELFLVVKPYSYGFRDYWSSEDTLRVYVPGDSIDFGINSVPSAIPEPSTWALIVGATALGVVVIRRRAARRV